MKVVILAGGFGTRISEESHLKPKPMIEIGEKPILWHIMKMYSRYGFKRDWLLDREKYVFEGEEFWGTREYDDCLSYLYGDYMKLPPEEKRVGHAPVSKLELNQEGL